MQIAADGLMHYLLVTLREGGCMKKEIQRTQIQGENEGQRCRPEWWKLENRSERIDEKVVLTRLPDEGQHSHGEVVHQGEGRMDVREDCVPHHEEVLQWKLSPKQKANPAAGEQEVWGKPGHLFRSQLISVSLPINISLRITRGPEDAWNNTKRAGNIEWDNYNAVKVVWGEV